MSGNRWPQLHYFCSGLFQLGLKVTNNIAQTDNFKNNFSQSDVKSIYRRINLSCMNEKKSFNSVHLRRIQVYHFWS